MLPSELFRHCPRCGCRRPETNSPFRCAACGFLYYFNPCCAVAGFIRNSAGEILLVRRAKEPARGQLAVPGGFIDIGETAEEALRRETREEVGLELDALTYLCSQINSYRYEEVTYPVLDFFFIAGARQPGIAQPLDGVEAIQWMAPERVHPNEIAFPSIRTALARYIAGQ